MPSCWVQTTRICRGRIVYTIILPVSEGIIDVIKQWLPAVPKDERDDIDK